MMTRGKRLPGKIDRKRLLLISVLVVALLIAIGAGLYMAGRKFELGNKTAEDTRGDLTGRFKERRSVVYDGHRYFYRNNLTTVLFMGVDQITGQNSLSSGFRNGGQADFLLLLVIDPKKEIISSIQIDRDTMAEITILGVLGNPSGTRTAQICLSHGFGDGREQSSGFTVDAVSKFLLGVDIDFYVAMNLDGIVTLNDLLGGVTVTLKDDFTMLDPTMRSGETLTLHGKQAEHYVRSRMQIGDGTNAARMVRQKDFMGKAGAMIGERLHENANFIGSLFDGLKDYLITDMSRGRMINVAAASRHYVRDEMISPAGEHTVGVSGYVEFHADEQAIERLVLEIFYEPAGEGQ